MLAQQPRAKTNRGKLETSMVRQEEWKKNRTKDKLFRAAQPVYTRKKRKRPESERQIPEEEGGGKRRTKKKKK